LGEFTQVYIVVLVATKMNQLDLRWKVKGQGHNHHTKYGLKSTLPPFCHHRTLSMIIFCIAQDVLLVVIQSQAKWLQYQGHNYTKYGQKGGSIPSTAPH